MEEKRRKRDRSRIRKKYNSREEPAKRSKEERPRISEFLDPTELHELTAPNPEAHRSEEQDEVFTIFLDAMEELKHNPHSHQAGIDRVWVQSGACGPGSFIAACEILGYDPDYIRRKLCEMERKQKEKSRPDKPFFYSIVDATAGHAA